MLKPIFIGKLKKNVVLSFQNIKNNPVYEYYTDRQTDLQRSSETQQLVQDRQTDR